MEVYERLDEMVELVEDARGVPLSDLCVVPRGPMLELMEAVRELMPASLRDAATILADRDDVLEDARREAEANIAGAQDQADAIIARAQDDAAGLHSQVQGECDALQAAAQADAARIVERARAEAERLVASDSIRLEAERNARVLREQAESEGSRVRAEADIYVDKRLAALEDTLRSALDQIGRGRRRASAAAPSPAAVNAQSTGSRETAIYDFTQDPSMAEDLGAQGRRRASR